ncbi:hypothetical protein [Variovorax sp. UMC13]|uniref:hypothetical protein n=1 Tax=Variovorax sp. UMC13 TaxID=1862326 RepID=UPI0016027402|nr:hypothetical protein [Variovorax sp. UMC13]MBB1601069.1 hypothetical protein [Variovorax sp. UMC13]
MNAVDHEKAFATLQAKAALVGLECRERKARQNAIVLFRRRALIDRHGRPIGWISRASEYWLFPDVACADLWLRNREAAGDKPRVGE